jgi:hypothetical protein
MRTQTESGNADNIVATKKYVDDNVGSININGGSCCICKTCGDNWLVEAGKIQLSRVVSLGDECAGAYSNYGTPTMFLCCTE